MFIIFNNIDILEDHNIGLFVKFMDDDQLISNFGETAHPHRIETRNSTDMDIPREVPEVDTAISHSTACSNDIDFVKRR